MKDCELENLVDELFYIYTLVNGGKSKDNCLSARTNKVLDFEKYIWKADWQMINKYCPRFQKKDMQGLRKAVGKMTAKNLDENIKTLALYWINIWEKMDKPIVEHENLTYIL